MTYEDLRFAIADGVAVVTLDRPADRNAFSGPMARSLAEAYRECDRRDDVRARRSLRIEVGQPSRIWRCRGR